MTEHEFKEQLGLLKGLTVKFGILHEAQTLQLEMWPLVIFNAISNTTTVDTEKHIVNFKVVINKSISQAKKEEGKKVLQSWVRTILWDNSGVEVEFSVIKNGRKKRTIRKG